LFGRQRVSNRTHLICTALVAIGTTFSAFWILVLNSWMQTPVGYRIENGVFFAQDWLEIVFFNPSFPLRMAHMLMASLLTSSFLVAGISAWRIRKNVHNSATWTALRTGVMIAAIMAPLQIFIGDMHGLNVFHHQPAKIAAVEAVWETEKGAAFTLIGFPNEKTKHTDFAIKLPHLASLVLTHEWDGEIKGLNEFAGEHPPVAIIFWAFRIMVGMGVLMVLVSWWAYWELFRKQRHSDLIIRVLSLMTFSGWIAVEAGWYVTEIGRQPWVVYGLLKASDVVAKHASATLMGTLLGYIGLYIFLLYSYFGALRYMASKTARSSD